ncbi:MAG: LLM class flavin-dependent oxidoreductase [Xanthobacteraceae bacterium]
MTRRALVIGGSLGGLIAVHLLRATGWDAVVFERNEEELASRGVGLGTHPQLIAILKRAGIAFDETMGIKVPRVVCLDCDGRVIVSRPTVRIMSGWARLYRALHDALPAGAYRLGRNLCRVTQDGAGVTAHFADGTREQGDLVVGADGIRSTLREQFLPQAQPVYAGYVAWRAVLDENLVPPDIRREIFELYTFCLPEGEQLLAYPVPGRDNDTAAGRRAYNIVWYRPADAHTLADLCSDAAGRHHDAGIPPPLIRPDVIARVKAEARALVAPQIAEIFGRATPFFQPIYDLESSRLAFGRVALLGDAAFVARPHVGAGTTKAAIDAASLADALREAGGDVGAGLARYERAQLPFGAEMVALAKEQGAYLSAQLKPREERSGPELDRDIGDVLRAHGTRSDQVRDIVTARGLDVHVHAPQGKGNKMQFGVQFFPNFRPADKSAAEYYAQSLDIAEEAEELGYTHARSVEHYFERYGGYSPNPMLFLAAAAARTKTMRLLTGAVVPAFNNPLKLAGEIAMLDAISDGRFDVGFARAFLPHEFRRFRISPDESIARFREGLEQIELLLTQENVSHHGQFHSFDAITSLPRPTQKPRPKFYIASTRTADSFEFAGRAGHALMSIPIGPLKDLIPVYRKAWRDAGHPGDGEVMVAFHMFCHEDSKKAREIPRQQFEDYFIALFESAGEWTQGTSSKDYKGYDESIGRMKNFTLESQIEARGALVGNPDEIKSIIRGFEDKIGKFEHASLQINFGTLDFAEAQRSMRLFARDVMPAFA